MPRRNFRELEARMSPASRRRSRALARQWMREMLLAEVRRAQGKTQMQVAKSLRITQPSLSKLESQSDIQVSTLNRIVEALGGELEVVAKLPTGSVRLTQFTRRHRRAS